MVNKKKISDAQANIERLIADQTKDGLQSKVVRKINPDLYALGQYIEDSDRNQRGIHGSAAGLRVLATSDSNKELVIGLASYLKDRTVIEPQISDQGDNVNDDKVARDDTNTIKLSETLYSLSFVKSGHIATDTFAQATAQKLWNGRIVSNSLHGWDYYNDGKQTNVNLLPTAFAVMALSIHGGHDVSKEKNTVLKIISEKPILNPANLAEFTYSLYVMMIVDKNGFYKKKHKEILTKIWNSEYCSLKDDYEQNIEYWYYSQHDYVRIPWQMFLMAITCDLSKSKFYTVSLQDRLNSVVNKTLGNGFVYPYSGSKVSTRTNAIIFDLIGVVKDNLNKNDNFFNSIYYYLLYFKDNVLLFFGKTYVRRIVSTLAVFACIYTSYSWYKDPEHSLSDIAPEFIGSIILFLVSLGKR